MTLDLPDVTHEARLRERGPGRPEQERRRLALVGAGGGDLTPGVHLGRRGVPRCDREVLEREAGGVGVERRVESHPAVRDSEGCAHGPDRLCPRHAPEAAELAQPEQWLDGTDHADHRVLGEITEAGFEPGFAGPEAPVMTYQRAAQAALGIGGYEHIALERDERLARA